MQYGEITIAQVNRLRTEKSTKPIHLMNCQYKVVDLVSLHEVTVIEILWQSDSMSYSRDCQKSRL